MTLILSIFELILGMHNTVYVGARFVISDIFVTFIGIGRCWIFNCECSFLLLHLDYHCTHLKLNYC